MSDAEFKCHDDYIAALLSAMDRERVVRSVVEVAPVESIAGFLVKPLTLFHYVALRDVMESPLIPPFRTPTPIELAAFLWLLSPGYNTAGCGRDSFLKSCRVFVPPVGLFATDRAKRRATRCFEGTVQAAKEFVEEALMDRPPMAANPGIREPDYYCDAVAITAALAREYGWSRENIMAMPMKIVFQHLKEIRDYRSAVNGLPAILGNPSDAVKNRWLEQCNRKN